MLVKFFLSFLLCALPAFGLPAIARPTLSRRAIIKQHDKDIALSLGRGPDVDPVFGQHIERDLFSSEEWTFHLIKRVDDRNAEFVIQSNNATNTFLNALKESDVVVGNKDKFVWTVTETALESDVFHITFKNGAAGKYAITAPAKAGGSVIVQPLKDGEDSQKWVFGI